MNQPVVIVTGSKGQLGSEIQYLYTKYTSYTWVFVDKDDVDLTDAVQVANLFQMYKPIACINCAAYTAVDKAEEEKALAAAVNTEAVAILAKNCAVYQSILIHISTDYVFDGAASTPYTTTHPTEPINHYGLTKRDGELEALKYNDKTIIIRTAWVYSSFGNNFVKTMLRLMDNRDTISVITDQVGSPTYARDLAEAILQLLEAETKHYGIYHYTNDGVISWHQFAVAIKELAGKSCEVVPIKSSEYPTLAKRPSYSVLDKERIIADYAIVMKNWKDSLSLCLSELKKTAL